MNRAINVWTWSLGVIGRSYRAVIFLAAVAGLWGVGAYGLLGVPAESSVLMMVVALAWALAQVVVAAWAIGGTAAAVGAIAARGDANFPSKVLGPLGRKKIFATIGFGLLSLVIIWGVGRTFDWMNDHSLEVASFLTFHAQKPVNQEALQSRVFDVIEWFVWVMVNGFLLSYFVVTLHSGWASARRRSGEILAGCVYKVPFVTGVLSMAVFGTLAHKLAEWHPLVPPGFWDYTQVVARFGIVLVLVVAGILFWTLSLARLFLAVPPPERTPAP